MYTLLGIVALVSNMDHERLPINPNSLAVYYVSINITNYLSWLPNGPNNLCHYVSPSIVIASLPVGIRSALQRNIMCLRKS